jgi:sec-independent protein translocase protein TatB
MMDFGFGVGYSELFVLAIIAVIVIGPKDLPKVLRTFGQFMRKARGMASEFQTHVDAAMRDTGLNDLKKEAQGLTQGLKKDMTVPSISSPFPASSPPKPDATFDTVFGADAEPGGVRVAGKLAESDQKPAAPA